MSYTSIAKLSPNFCTDTLNDQGEREMDENAIARKLATVGIFRNTDRAEMTVNILKHLLDKDDDAPFSELKNHSDGSHEWETATSPYQWKMKEDEAFYHPAGSFKESHVKAAKILSDCGIIEFPRHTNKDATDNAYAECFGQTAYITR